MLQPWHKYCETAVSKVWNKINNQARKSAFSKIIWKAMKLFQFFQFVQLAKATSYSNCVALESPENGELECSGHHCSVKCDGGFLPTGLRKIKCRGNHNSGYSWKRELGGCGTCQDLVPNSGIVKSCDISSRCRCDLANSSATRTWIPMVCKAFSMGHGGECMPGVQQGAWR